jgi:hypothetical protein
MKPPDTVHNLSPQSAPSRQIANVVLVRPASAALLKRIKADQKRWDKEHSEESKRKKKEKKKDVIAPTSRVTFYSPQYPEDEKLLVAFREYVETQELHEPRWVRDDAPPPPRHRRRPASSVSHSDRAKAQSVLMVHL